MHFILDSMQHNKAKTELNIQNWFKRTTNNSKEETDCLFGLNIHFSELLKLIIFSEDAVQYSIVHNLKVYNFSRTKQDFLVKARKLFCKVLIYVSYEIEIVKSLDIISCRFGGFLMMKALRRAWNMIATQYSSYILFENQSNLTTHLWLNFVNISNENALITNDGKKDFWCFKLHY